MATSPLSRRWYQFSLLTLLLAFTAFGILSALARRNVLAEKTTVQFDSQPLADVLAYLSIKHEFRCLVDKTALDAARIDPNKVLFTDKLSEIPLGDALKQLLDPHGLAYRVESGDLVVTTHDALRSPRQAGKRRLIDINNDPDWP